MGTLKGISARDASGESANGATSLVGATGSEHASFSTSPKKNGRTKNFASATRSRRSVVRHPTRYSDQELSRNLIVDWLTMKWVLLRIDHGNALGIDLDGFARRNATTNVKDFGGNIRIRSMGETWDPNPETRDSYVCVKTFMDLNPSRISHPDRADGGLAVRDLTKFLGILSAMFAAAGIPATDFLDSGVALSRIHLARDATADGISVPDFLMAHLLDVPRRGGPTGSLHRTQQDGRTHDYFKIFRQPYELKLYDQKSAHGPSMPTDVRCELVIKQAKYSRYWDFRHPSLVTPEQCGRTFRETFERANFGAATSAGRFDLTTGRVLAA